MEGIASIALLPSGSISGHFIQLPHSVSYALHGTGLHPFLCFLHFLLWKLFPTWVFLEKTFKLHMCDHLLYFVEENWWWVSRFSAFLCGELLFCCHSLNFVLLTVCSYGFLFGVDPMEMGFCGFFVCVCVCSFSQMGLFAFCMFYFVFLILFLFRFCGLFFLPSLEVFHLGFFLKLHISCYFLSFFCLFFFLDMGSRFCYFDVYENSVPILW